MPLCRDLEVVRKVKSRRTLTKKKVGSKTLTKLSQLSTNEDQSKVDADREALLQWGRPVTTDSLVSMPHGPVVSRIYDLISVGPREDGQGSPSAWHRHITRSGQYDVTLSAVTSDDELSIAENGVISQIWDRHGKKSKWTLRDETHDLPEWQDPNGSSIPIEYEDILRAENRPSDEIDAVHSELMNLARLQSI